MTESSPPRMLPPEKMPVRSSAQSLPALFWAAATLVLCLCWFGLMNPKQFAHQVEGLNQQIYGLFGGYYLWFAWLCLLAFVGIGMSPLGKIRLGGAEAKPEHRFVSWFAMLFCAGMGTGFMFWGAAEPLYHFMNPPLIEAKTVAQMKILAFRYTFFHWGFHPWAIYGMSALAIGFFGFNLQKGFYFSSFLAGAQESKQAAWLKTAIDFVTILAILFGIAATIGMGVLQLQGGFTSYFHLPQTPLTQLGILILCTAAYLLSTLKGLDKGIKILSNINLGLSILLMLAVLGVAQELDILNLLAETLGAYLSTIPDMSLGLGHFHQPHWVGDWTVKYWSWWIAWAPFVGLFIAFISKGRTIRELVLGVLVAPTLFSCLWFAIFGNAAITMQLAHQTTQSLSLQHVDAILFSLLDTLCQSPYLGWLSLSLVAINFINSADSATYTISCLSVRNLDAEPPAKLQLAWGGLFASVAGLLLLTGGIDILQQVTTITVLPFTLLLSCIFVTMIIRLIQYQGKALRPPIVK